MKPNWALKRDLEHHPVRFLAGLWQQRMTANFRVAERPLTPKELGQLKSLRKVLGDLTRDVIEWMVDPVNWWHFRQQIRAESKNHMVTEHPHIGLLVLRRGTALKVMRSKLSNCSAGAKFLRRLDHKEFEQMKTLALLYAEGKPERLDRIEAAKTLTEIQKVFIDLVDESMTAST
jgi:hypothetical protein